MSTINVQMSACAKSGVLRYRQLARSNIFPGRHDTIARADNPMRRMEIVFVAGAACRRG